ncbi:FxsB family cyclophane-forming radical SAM/SPASM peptide maturase [Streptomyces polygonati]|uniref:FxsB family cyclophane-forming radical SAM/SPASM peptide maturase n=1 Tax=Streptomyces polygonati TaxID=1617087 RepID=A0ABV8HVH3_9ACTN
MTVKARAFRQFVLKVHSRCDLACDHCYIYEHADQSWARRPRVISDATVRATASRIAEHARAHPELPRVHVILHGGEPLLAGRERLARIASTLRSALDGVCDLDLRMQTNGLRLDEEFCAMLVRERISTGISLDGDRTANDRHRKRSNGAGSYDAVVRAVRLIGSPPYRPSFAGLLCTVDVQNDPLAVYEALTALEPPRVDFLLPHATWDRPPERDPGLGTVPYAQWLTTVYDRWTADGRPFPVRLFDSLEQGREGRESFTEALGLGSPDLVVVETDGEIEQADWLKTVEQGAPSTGFDVRRHSFDRAAAHPGFLARRTGLGGLSEKCRGCDVVRVCGGGLYGHRWSSGKGPGDGFDNPSVYCDDLFALISHVLEAPRPEPIARPHTLSASGFDSLAAGRNDDEALRALVAAEFSARRLLVGAVCGRYPGPEAEALTELDRRQPQEVAEVLRHPYLGAWAIRSLEGHLEPAAVRLRLGEIATAAALAAGTDLRLELPPGTTTVHLPALGRLILPGCVEPVALGTRRKALLLAFGDHRPPLPVAGATGRGFRWEPARRIIAGEFRFLLEDGDPYRDGFTTEPSPMLDEEEFHHWQRLFGEAGRHLGDRYDRHAPGIRALLTACTPLRGEKAGGFCTANPLAFGAFGLAPPENSARLAELIVEGVQQVKFNALLDLFDLADGDEARESLRSAYLDRAHRAVPPDHGLTAYGRRMAAVLRG